VNITNKIQMFHDILGEDARYLSDGEEFGSQELFSTLSNKKSYTGEDQEGDSELKYLELIRQIRDEHPKFFEKIKRLPKKARSGFAQANHDGDELITFFRKGRLKKFYTAKNGESTEITFFDAVNQLECKPETPRSNTPKTFFALLETNKRCFEKDSLMEEEEAVSSGNSSVKYIEKRLKDRSFKNYQGFTESNEEFIRGVQEVLAQGKITKIKAKTIKQELEKVTDPLKMLGVLEKYIPVGKVDSSLLGTKFAKREVILSGYLTK
jgi:hypothetical protein